jgi:hypothetical protein
MKVFSVEEKLLKQDKPQCGACRNISANLKTPICNSCIGYYSMSLPDKESKLNELISEHGNNIPFSILKLPGAASLLINNAPVDSEDLGSSWPDTQSKLAKTILESAYSHQQNMSDKRLGGGAFESCSHKLWLKSVQKSFKSQGNPG